MGAYVPAGCRVAVALVSVFYSVMYALRQGGFPPSRYVLPMKGNHISVHVKDYWIKYSRSVFVALKVPIIRKVRHGFKERACWEYNCVKWRVGWRVPLGYLTSLYVVNITFIEYQRPSFLWGVALDKVYCLAMEHIIGIEAC